MNNKISELIAKTVPSFYTAIEIQYQNYFHNQDSVTASVTDPLVHAVVDCFLVLNPHSWNLAPINSIYTHIHTQNQEKINCWGPSAAKIAEEKERRLSKRRTRAWEICPFLFASVRIRCPCPAFPNTRLCLCTVMWKSFLSIATTHLCTPTWQPRHNITTPTASDL